MGSDLLVEHGDTGSCAVSPLIAYASALSPARGSLSSSELARRTVSPINAKGFSYKEAIGVKELIHSYPTLRCPST